jgi:hypothetical protein
MPPLCTRNVQWGIDLVTLLALQLLDPPTLLQTTFDSYLAKYVAIYKISCVINQLGRLFGHNFKFLVGFAKFCNFWLII